MQNENAKNIILFSLISMLIMVGWIWLYEKPRMEDAQRKLAETQKLQTNPINAQAIQQNSKPSTLGSSVGDESIAIEIKNDRQESILTRDQAIAIDNKNRIQIITPELHGSINLQGVTFDDITLVNYKETNDPQSKEVVLLSPQGYKKPYHTNFGFSKGINRADFPNDATIWKSDSKILTPEKPITLSWKNKQNIVFEIKISVDKHYMFTISQGIKNYSKEDIITSLNSMTRRINIDNPESSYIMHEGPIGVFDGILKEISYSSLTDTKIKSTFDSKTGWFGMTDKYWLASIIPDKRIGFEVDFVDVSRSDVSSYNLFFKSKSFKVLQNQEVFFDNKFFVGAKKVSVLDQYSKQYDIPLFDRAIDFGWYYFLTKPFFFILQFFNNLLGNYGLAILSITVLVKLAMFPLANKSYMSIAKIKKLQPKINKIREEYKDQKMQMNKEIMALYKREKVNPVSGCLPMLVQIPVFFSLYKVLYLTIDMRHAPFYGWIKDLSAQDPSTILNLFGLLPFQPQGFLAVGILPILIGITMVIQQKLNPQPADPAQAKMMKMLPIILIFVFAAFPAGLLIYWTWSNILSIIQQWIITKKVDR